MLFAYYISNVLFCHYCFKFCANEKTSILNYFKTILGKCMETYFLLCWGLRSLIWEQCRCDRRYVEFKTEMVVFRRLSIPSKMDFSGQSSRNWIIRIRVKLKAWNKRQMGFTMGRERERRVPRLTGLPY